MYERFKCFNVNFRLLKTMHMHLLVCYLNNPKHKFAFGIFMYCKCMAVSLPTFYVTSHFEGPMITTESTL